MKVKRPGLRIIKTSLAVFLSLVLSYLRSENSLPFYSAIAAVICLKTDVHGTIKIGLNRILGSFVGGFFSFIYLILTEKSNINPIINYFFIAMIISFLIWMMANLKKPNAITIMAIVFMSITINHAGEETGASSFALARTMDTVLGVVAAIIINWVDFEIRGRLKNKKRRK